MRKRLVAALCVPVVALSLLVACGRDDPLNEPAGRFGTVEADHARALRLSAAEATAGELVALDLKEPETDSPEWESRITDRDGRLTTVRLDATRGEALGTSTGPGLTDSEHQELTRLLEEARILPDEAAREAAETAEGDAVTAVDLQERDGDPVRQVSVLGVADETATIHVVDAKTGEVLDRSPA